MKAIQNELTNNNELIDKIRNNAALKSSGNDQQFIDQESLDYLLDVAGVSNLEISLEEVNSLIGESLAAQDLGYDIYIQNNIAMSSQAKFYLEDIVNNETFIVGLEQQQSFLNLSNEEQNILVGVNNYAKNYITKSKDPFFNDGFWVGSSVGSALGLSIPFCPPCGLVGWIVGGIVGSLTK
ncbi:hypothetical protein [Nonlabens xylanidelens]|nr:hypothetical protein [Nonlabens xylanidelens]PQJ13723.1 hypothetical protein BST94_15390 [Nonlabens xylanidelens]